MRNISLILLALSLAACARGGAPDDAPAPAAAAPAAETDTAASAAKPAGNDGLRIGGGYRSGDDQCRRVGANEVTAPFVNAETDLVGCPISFAGRPAFIQATKAREVTRTANWVLYSVPLFGSAPVTNIPPTPPITGG